MVVAAAPAIGSGLCASYKNTWLVNSFFFLCILAITRANLCNLDKVASKRFTFVGLPLKIRGGTGSSIGAIAVLEN